MTSVGIIKPKKTTSRWH